MVDTPFSTYQVKRTETQENRALELSQEHTHETDTGEVANATYTLVILVKGNAELIPFHRLTSTVTEGNTCLTYIRNVVSAHLHVLWSDADPILVVPLVFIQGVVLVDILYIGEGLIARIEAFRLLFTVRRVTLWQVDTLVTVEDGGLSRIQV